LRGRREPEERDQSGGPKSKTLNAQRPTPNVEFRLREEDLVWPGIHGHLRSTITVVPRCEGGGLVLSTRVNRHTILGDMKASYVLAFLCGAAVILGVSALSGSNAESRHHVYELRLYHVKEGKIDALRARFGNYTDAIFKRHNMKSIGYWSPEDAPDSQNLFIYILEHPSRQEAEKNWAGFQADLEWQKVKAESEAHGALVDHIDHYFMDPTSFSALR